ncbi:MAG: prepilin-type N-terminal cleavage/methylation domain-containing protein [Armatimonadota bacterium]
MHELRPRTRAAGGTGRCRGFTLVEVVVATVVLAVGLVGALTAFSMAARASAVSSSDTVLIFLAQEKLSEIQLLGRGGLANAEAHGDFGPEHPEYQWRMQVGRPDERNVVRVDLAISYPEAGRTREEIFSTNVF